MPCQSSDNRSVTFLCSGRDDLSQKKKSRNSPKKVLRKHATESLMTDTEHENLRTGLQSIMSQMDEMLADMKNKPKK